MASDLAVVILAAGRSVRFKSRKTKVLHDLAGRPLLEWVLRTVRGLSPGQCVIVHGNLNGDELKQRFGTEFDGMPLAYALQDPPRGTGDALLQAETALSANVTHFYVLPGDAPLVAGHDLLSLQRAVAAGADHAVLTARVLDPTGYGRILRQPDTDAVLRIVEQAETDAQTTTINEINSGMYLFSRQVFDHLRQAQQAHPEDRKEYYLPDVAEHSRMKAVEVANAYSVEGINDRAQLARMEAYVQDQLRQEWMRAGVTFILPETNYLHANVEIEEDVTIGPNCMLLNGTRIESGSEVGQGCVLDGARIGQNCKLLHVRALEAVLEDDVTAGPFVNLRPGTILRDGVRVGNFVETKQAEVGSGSKLPHLSYIGDATLGSDCNIGAGTIFCNYDGVNKHHTRLGNRVFVGSNSSLQAPLNLGDDSFVAMASAVTHDVPAEALAVARSRQVNKPHYARRLRNKTSQKALEEAAAEGEQS
jgi:bifunctional UDP-N-acetylglucosamine pyrophosphorylase/glucosamine-1-phosphate N-acetyltransferase